MSIPQIQSLCTIKIQAWKQFHNGISSKHTIIEYTITTELKKNVKNIFIFHFQFLHFKENPGNPGNQKKKFFGNYKPHR